MPNVVAGANIYEKLEANDTTRFDNSSANEFLYRSLSQLKIFVTPSSFWASLMTEAVSEPATSNVISLPISLAAATVFRVAPLRLVLSCSAITNIFILSPSLHFSVYQPTHQHFQQ